MSMDTGGTDRIIKRQIKEWHALAENNRNARLLKETSPEAHRSLMGAARQTVSAIAWRLAVIRARLSGGPAA